MANPGALAIVSPALLLLAAGLWLATRLVARSAPAEARPAVAAASHQAASHQEVLQRYRSPAASTPAATSPAHLVSVAGTGGTTATRSTAAPLDRDQREVA